MDADTYNQLFTLHGAIMVFLFIIPSIPAALGNFFLPMMLGAKDVAFPRLNLLSFYIYVVGRDRRDLLASSSARWTPAGPSTRRTACTHRTRRVISMTTGGVHPRVLARSSPGVNFIATVHKLRAPGMRWFDMPLFVWGIYATAIIQVLATPVLGITLLPARRWRGAAHRDLRPASRRRPGALPALLLVLLAPGRLHHDPAGHGHHQRDHRARSRASTSSATSSSRTRAPWRIALLGFLVWGHHMFVAGQCELRDDGVLVADLPRRDPLGRQGLQLDGDAVQRVDLVHRRRCSTRSRSSCCSPSAA